VNDDVITVPLIVSYPLNFTFEVWVANHADCTLPANRTGGQSPICSRILSTTTLATPNTTVDLHVRDIMYGLNHPGSSNAAGSGTLADCDAPSQSNPQPQSLDIWFMFLNGQAVDSSTDLGITFALLGPSPPGGISVGSADGFLKVSWTPPNPGTVAGFYFFCSPKPGTELPGGGRRLDAGDIVGGGGASGTGGAGGSSGTGGTCDIDASNDAGDASCTTDSSGSGGAGGSGGSSGTGVATGTGCDILGELSGGASPTQALFASNGCGSADGATANAGLVTGLVNGNTYAISVAAYDSLGNTGVLSVPTCGIPLQVDDFITTYRTAGGTAGGSSFCSVSSLGRGSRSGAAGAMLVGAALALYRARTPKGRRRARRGTAPRNAA
jgi:hypothetical protein